MYVILTIQPGLLAVVSLLSSIVNLRLLTTSVRGIRRLLSVTNTALDAFNAWTIDEAFTTYLAAFAAWYASLSVSFVRRIQCRGQVGSGTRCRRSVECEPY